ncbi:hypothetical protein EYZ11_005565 [Aspergillus tanneri]|uniref:Uncharacterized protein n=1 Tax=Aspergillus tanneri TaxID=1220188 RepID=A0A4S3JNM5_9EURO|nr:uncharacterized protein ATNIH1004_000981 [Aspergillus tanneri]KAA8652077.1 hypothetical protein ATNIH1004_000981 [Aspergillus tanneri]THC94971.1 hypothetical protein EYZ11_005565 [Aspergillus tanneri]
MPYSTFSAVEDVSHPPRYPPPIPPSPTLSNPDMILPFDQKERESSTPSPPFNLPSLSHLQSFYGSQQYPADFGGDATEDGIHAPANRPQKKGFPRHTWQHEGHEAGRRLSDIGEEDASSATHLSGLSVRNPGVIEHDDGLAGSPLPHRVEETENQDTGTWSSSSSSTISGASEASSQETKVRANGPAVSHEVHSMGHDQLREKVRAIETGTNGDSSRLSVVSTTEEGSPVDEMSSVVLSSEAERILENAKQRLTLMEGNLTRARSSMRVSPLLPTSPTPSVGMGQPVGGLYRSISRTDRRPSALRPRATYTSSQDFPSNRHSRVYSETNVPSASLSVVDLNPSRSVSAMGSSTTSNFNNGERSFQYAPNRAYLTHRSSINALHPTLAEEHILSDTSRGLGISTEESGNKASSAEEFNSAHPSHDSSSRSQSQLQVRDLQDQMKGLHIKISSLKVKAQEDNLRRRSLQSLRTPSPFTATEHWHNTPLESKDHHSIVSPGCGHTPEHVRERRSIGELDSAVDGQEPSGPNVSEELGVKSQSMAYSKAYQPNKDDDGQSVAESLYEDAQEGEYDTDGSSNSEIDREALNEILREPLDDDLQDPLEAFPAVPQSNDSRPHEEREDAFDYENFILHSALGSYTQSRLRRGSEASNSSVETTRPTHDRQLVRHSRANSGASVSTIATFATAIEGDRDDIESVLYWDRRFNAEMLEHHPYHGYEDAAQYHPDHADSEQMGTPRAIRRQLSLRNGVSNGEEHLYLDARSTSQRSDSATTGSATPTALASSLVSTVRAASSSHPSSAERGNMGLNGDDTRLLENLFKSLGDVCMDLQTITTSADPDPKLVRLLRWRLDAARRVLDGELDT